MMTFLDLNISQSTIEKLNALDIIEPTPVQEKVIPSISEGKNLIFQSETGTGKTFAYLLPLLKQLENDENIHKSVRLIIASPTYELSSQLKTTVQSVSDYKVQLCIGGAPIKRQAENLKEKPTIVIGNPARLLELIRLGKLKTDGIKFCVLDEADRLVMSEIRDETTALLAFMPKSSQFIACSATMSENTKRVLENEIGKMESILMPPEDVLAKHITHWALFAEQRDKISTLKGFLLAEKPTKTLIFTSRSDQVENIVAKLKYKNVECMSIHAHADKKERKAAIDKFKSGKCKILITSDLSSRGLDIPGVTHIVQMDLPSNEDFFVHRAGRTARAGKTGINLVIGDSFEMRKFAALEKKYHFVVYPKILYCGKLYSPEELEKNNGLNSENPSNN